MDDSLACSVYVGGIGPDVTEELLAELFAQVGPVEEVAIPAGGPAGAARVATSRLRARLVTSAPQGDSTPAPPPVAAPIRVRDVQALFAPFGTVLAFDVSASSTSPGEEEALVVFGGSEACSNAATKLDGMVLGAQTLRTTPAPLLADRFGFVTFTGRESVLYAVRVLNGVVLCGRTLSVEERHPKEPMGTAAEEEAAAAAAAATGASSSARAGSMCTVSGISADMTREDVRDLVEWAARSVCTVTRMTFVPTADAQGGGLWQAVLTCALGPGAVSRAVQVLHGRQVAGVHLECNGGSSGS